jgi:hypothetical protein
MNTRTRNPVNLAFIQGLARKGCAHRSKRDYKRNNNLTKLYRGN